jgi:competence protein ComEA
LSTHDDQRPRGGDRLRRLRDPDTADDLTLDPPFDLTVEPGSRYEDHPSDVGDAPPRSVPDGTGGGPEGAGRRASGVSRSARSTSWSGAVPDGGSDRAAEPAAGAGALFAVAQAYTAANGHPTTHAGFEHVPDGGPRRWSVRARTAVVAVVAALMLATGVGSWALVGGDDVRSVASLGPGAATSGSPGDAAEEVTRGPVPPRPGLDEQAEAGTDQAATDQAATDPGGRDVVVHVVGAVAAPGLVTVPQGSRVADALSAAGNATPVADLAGVNLAREVVDGEQIVVPVPGEVVAAAPGPSSGGAPGGTGPGAPVDLNTADEAALDALSGIGPVLAARIVEWREANGPFTTVEELGEVSGIGDALLARLRDQVRV